MYTALIAITVTMAVMDAKIKRDEESDLYASQQQRPQEDTAGAAFAPKHPEGWYSIPVEFRNSCGSDEWECLKEWETHSEAIAAKHKSLPKKWKEKCTKAKRQGAVEEECAKWRHSSTPQTR